MISMSRFEKRKGVALLTTIILLSLASFLGVMLLKFTLDIQRVDEIRNDGIKAFYIAEAGVNEVVHFFNHPEDYTPSSNLFDYDESNNTFPNLSAYLAANDVLTLDSSVLPSFNLDNGTLHGNVVSLEIVKPSNSDPVTSIGVIKSTGRTQIGVEKTIYMYVLPGGPAFEAPAAIISKINTTFNGNVRPHWGEVWSLAPTQLQSFSTNSSNGLAAYVDITDPGWTVARTNNYFFRKQGQTNYYMDGTNNGTTTLPNPIVENPYQNTAYDGRFLQDQDLVFPEYNYAEYKTLALQRGEYYSTDAQGNIYRNGIETQANQVNVNTEFFSATPGGDFRVVFIDTIDGNPPAANGSNLANISLSGGSPHYRGLIYFAANLNTTGMGNPPTVTVLDPTPSSVSLSKLWVDGVIYISGTWNVGGNPKVYGSVIAEREITGNGTPDVYYNYRLADGEYFPVGSRVKIQLFRLE